MKLICEELDNTTEFLTEEKDGKKNLYIEGVFMQAETLNRNGRFYPKSLLEREVNRYVTNYVNENRAFGELNHPQTPSVNLERASHLITKLEWAGNDVMGKARIIEGNPCGKIVMGIQEAGGRFGVSTRGVGSLKKINNRNIVQDDYYLATGADIVADPSGPKCWVNGIMEGAEWVMVDDVWVPQYVEQAKKVINEAHKIDKEDIAFALFKNFMSKL